MSISLEYVVSLVITILLVMFSATVHEVAHGWVAYKCGDPTAKDAGRLTLNPKAHLDGFGSIVLPIILGLLGGPIIAFAKPVPYNPKNFKNPRRDEVLVALAGPVSNFLQALAGTLLLKIVWYPGVFLVTYFGAGYTVLSWIVEIIETYMYVNLVLCFFNLIPLPPLDGSKVILYFLKGKARQTYYKLQDWSMFILLVVIVLVPLLFNVDPLSDFLDFTAGNVFDALLSVV